MVQIVPPAGWDLNASATEQRSAAADAALSLSTTASLIIPASAIDDLSRAMTALDHPVVDVPAEVAPSTVAPPATAGSPVTLWAFGGVVAVTVLAGLTWALWPGGNDKVIENLSIGVAKSEPQVVPEHGGKAKPTTPSGEQQASKTSDANAAPVKADVAPATQPANTMATAEPVTADSASKTAERTQHSPRNPLPVPAKKDTATAKHMPKVAIAEPTPTNATPAPTSKAADAASKSPDHSPVFKFDPLDFDVNWLGANGKTPPDSSASTSSIPNKPPIEAAVVSASEQGKQPVGGDAALPLAANNGVTVRRGPPGDALQRMAGQALATRVKLFQVTEMPLVRFIETVSGVAGIGITLDPIALEQVGISPQATVSASAQDAPLKSILHEGLMQRRLDFAEQRGQLRVVLPKADEAHSIDYDVKDLAAGTDATAVGQLIEHFVAPTTWKSAGGKGTLSASGTTLHIEQSDAVRRQVVIFCERLRLARGLVVQSKYPASLLSIDSPYQHLSAKLSEPVTFTFLPWTRLDDVARNWQELSGLTVLIDWGALAEVELGPSSPIACSANDRPWQESLDGVLEPLGLGWWAVNGETIQITSLAALDKLQRIEFYNVPPKLRASFATDQALIDSLQKELSEAAGKQARPAAPYCEFDDPSGRLIVLARPAAHRHLSQRLASGAKQ